MKAAHIRMIRAAFELTIIMRFSEEVFPFCNDFLAACFDNCHDISKCTFWNFGIVVAKIALSGFRNPNFRAVAIGHTFRYMNMDRLKRIAFIGPEIYPI